MPESLTARLIEEHRSLDDLFGRFLAASQAGEVTAAAQAIAAFDDDLRRHTDFEESRVLALPEGHKLLERENESDRDRLSRELRLEHVQIREVSGMIRRMLEESRDLDGARRLAPNLARRWDAHTRREEREILVP